MRHIANLERLLERALERPAARLFRTRLQPIQIQRRIERAMDGDHRADGRRVRVADRFSVRLAPVDLTDLASSRGIAALAGELADAALLFARSRGYVLDGRPNVDISPGAGLRAGAIEVEAAFSSDDAAGPGGGIDHTAVYEVPTVRSPTAMLREVLRDGSERSVPIDGTLLSIGRAEDNGLVLGDPRVSRHHAQVRARHGMLVLTDLDSRNGVRVNGARVMEAALGPGDRIEIGDSVLIVDAIAPD